MTRYALPRLDENLTRDVMDNHVDEIGESSVDGNLWYVVTIIVGDDGYGRIAV